MKGRHNLAATKKKAPRKKASRKKSARKASTRSKPSGARKKSTRAKRTSAKRTGGKRLSTMTTNELTAELARRQRRLPALRRQHADLLGRLDAIEAEIAEIEGAGAAPARGRGGASRRRSAGGGKRPRNEMNLEDALAKTLSGKTMSVTEATEAVKSNGYQTTAANFRTIVNATLLKSKKIKKVARGQYTAK